jgi:hypothetical protein
MAAGPILDSTTNPGALETAYERELSNLQRDREDLIGELSCQVPATGDRTNQSRDRNDELNAAHAITTNALGQSARSVDALVDAGIYRGVVLGETECYLVQRQSAGMAVLHRKDLLDRQPQVGEVLSINYSNGRGLVQEFRERAKANELGR